MKKILLPLIVFGFIFFSLNYKSNAQSPFYEAIKTCAPYEQLGGMEYQKEYFNILVTLEKSKNKCVYKEKIFQGKDYQMLTCQFDNSQLPFLSDSMKRFNDTFKNEIAKNKIFEAKMTTNGEIFQKYLIDKSICQITHSKKK